MTTETNLERGAVYGLLARLWQSELNRDLLTNLQEDELRRSYEVVGGYVPPSAASDELDQLAMDFCQLFIGPNGHFPPYQSVWIEGRFESKTVASLREYVEILGDAGDWSLNNPLDHFAVELDMMSFILIAKSKINDLSDQQDALVLASCFFHDHLVWAIPLCEAAHKRSETEFYQRLTKLTGDFIQEEQTNFPAVHSQ